MQLVSAGQKSASRVGLRWASQALQLQNLQRCRAQVDDERSPERLSNDLESSSSSAASPTASSSSYEGSKVPYGVVAGLAAAGLAETAYLTAVKLFGADLVCPTSGCESVLTSQYSSLFGIPLSAFGMLAYGAVGALAASALRSSSSSQPDAATSASDSMLLAGGTLLASCSGLLMYILQTQLQGEPCVWCYASAGQSQPASLRSAFPADSPSPWFAPC